MTPRDINKWVMKVYTIAARQTVESAGITHGWFTTSKAQLDAVLASASKSDKDFAHTFGYGKAAFYTGLAREPHHTMSMSHSGYVITLVPPPPDHNEYGEVGL